MATQDRLQSVQRAEKKLKALCDPLRLRIVDLLRNGEQTVGQIAEVLGQESVGASHHLGILYQAGIVQRQKRGRFVAYRLGEHVLDAHASTRDFLDLGCCRLEVPK